MSKIVKLNVGGKQFQTTEMTLMRFDYSMLAVMIQQPNEMEKINQGQELFIDQDGEYFGYVLDYLRDGDQMTIPQENTVRGRLIDEANFYQLPGLASLIKGACALKVGDIVQLRDSDGARAYFDSVMNMEKHSSERDAEHKCWFCFGIFPLPYSFADHRRECRDSNRPIKYDIMVGKIATIDGHCAAVTVTKGCLLAVFSLFLKFTNDDIELPIHMPLPYLKLFNQ